MMEGTKAVSLVRMRKRTGSVLFTLDWQHNGPGTEIQLLRGSFKSLSVSNCQIPSLTSESAAQT
jgi:hypothetical protein